MTAENKSVDEMEIRPRLRVAPLVVEIEGRQMLLFQDEERITEETVVMPVEAAAVIQFFDGSKSVREIQEEFMRQSGQLLDSRIIEDVVAQLDEHLLLDSPRLHQHLRQLNEQWMENRVRPAALAGRGYPGEKKDLVEFLDSFYPAPEGPGLPGASSGADGLKGIVAPHMDIRDSGSVTAHAFKALAERTEAGLFVVFGTGHMEAQRMFVPTDKDFETPLGVARTDREMVERINRLRRDRNPLDDYIHKQEHSIEFMVLFLQHALSGKRDFRIVPVLTAGMTPSIISGMPPSEEPAFLDFMGALKQAISERGEPVCFIAGADLAHLGPRYGDRETYAPIRMGEEEESDRRMLGPLLSGDKEGFFDHVSREKDRRKICGLSPIYSLMEASSPKKGELLKWGYWHDSATHSVVTFASMAFY